MLPTPIPIKIKIKIEKRTMDFYIHHHKQLDIHMFGHQSQSRQSLRQRDWDSHKTEIEQRYAHQELRIVMNQMESIYGFHATEKQWKSQLRKWGMKKRTGGSDYKAMLKKKRERELQRPGIQTEFFLRGEPVSQAKIDRYESEARKKGKITKDEMFEDVQTPPYLSFTTPPSSPVLSRIPSSPSEPSVEDEGSPSDRVSSTMPVSSVEAMMYYMNYSNTGNIHAASNYGQMAGYHYPQAEQPTVTPAAYTYSYPQISPVSYSPATSASYPPSSPSTTSYPDPTLYSGVDYAAYYRTALVHGRPPQ